MIFGALVIVLIILALAFLIIPVLKTPQSEDSVDREAQNINIAKEKKEILVEQLNQQQMTQDEYESALVDLENSLAIDLERQQALDANLQAGKWVVWFFAAFVPIISFYLYIQFGEYRVIENPALTQPTAHAQTTQGSGKVPSMSELLEKLENHLRDSPEDSRGWYMLGRTYMSMRRYPEAVDAYQKSYDLNSQEPSIMLALADSLAMRDDGKMTGQPEKLVMEALKLSPNELTGLWLAGMAAEQGGRYREAHDYWTRLLPMLADDPQSAAEVKNLLAGLSEKQPDLPKQVETPVVVSTGLRVAVTLDERLASLVNENDLLFIYAKAASGPPMPLAAKRLKVSDLPIDVELSDQDAMMPKMKLSGFEQVIVGARISKSGNPVAQSGDLFNESEVIDRKSHQGVVEIRINRVN